MLFMKYFRVVFLCVFLAACSSGKKPLQESNWVLEFKKADSLNPILLPDRVPIFSCPLAGPVQWEEKDVFNPAAVVRHDTVFMLYRAEDNVGKFAGTSRIGIAWSTDGLHFTRNEQPVLYPDNDPWKKYEWEGGCEDPRVVEDSAGIYYIYYTSYDGDKARLMVASSPDLYHWTKFGPVFAEAGNGKYLNTWSKSGSVVSRYVAGRIIAVKINGYYQMYWGDTNIFLARSTDLTHWEPVENNDGTLQVVFGPRAGKFDSDLVEPGPPAMLCEYGIRLLYNSRNVPSKGDSTLAEGTYAASQILMDSTNPGKVLHRMESWFMKPDKPYEITGQVNRVCFIEGLVHYKQKWFLYYGTADSRIAAAVRDDDK